jgi:hypothetical protein
VAGKICRGENVIVNGLTDAAITQAWMFTQLQNDEATIIDQLRQALIQFDKQERANNHVDCKTDCVFGNNIDQYHIVAFEEAGLNPVFYGGNVPQGTPGNPVQTDPSRGPHE